MTGRRWAGGIAVLAALSATPMPAHAAPAAGAADSTIHFNYAPPAGSRLIETLSITTDRRRS